MPRCCVCKSRPVMCTITEITPNSHWTTTSCEDKCKESQLAEVIYYRPWGRCRKENSEHGFKCSVPEAYITCTDTVFNEGWEHLLAPKLPMCGVQPALQVSSQVGGPPTPSQPQSCGTLTHRHSTRGGAGGVGDWIGPLSVNLAHMRHPPTAGGRAG